MGKISDVAANVSIGYQPEVHTQHICYRLSMIDKSQFILLEGLGERHDLQGPGRLQQAAAVRAQRNEEGGTGGSLMIFVLDIWISVMSLHPNTRERDMVQQCTSQVGSELESKV